MITMPNDVLLTYVIINNGGTKRHSYYCLCLVMVISKPSEQLLTLDNVKHNKNNGYGDCSFGSTESIVFSSTLLQL